MNQDEKYVVPEYLMPYIQKVSSYSKEEIEDFMNDKSSTVFNNAPRALICVSVKTTVDNLEKLYSTGLLKDA